MFTFNKHHVCTNPNVYPVIYESDFEAEIYTASMNDRWMFGFNWTNRMGGYQGASTGVWCGEKSTKFDSEDEAKRYAVERQLIKHLESFKIKHPEYRSTCEKYIRQCQEFISDTYQLSLF